MEKKIDSSKIGSNEIELVDFRIMKEVNGQVYEGIYGINVAKVREIIRLPKLTELPGVPPFIEGIFDLRGVVIPVINLSKWMKVDTGRAYDKKVRIIIAEFNNILIGFIVHEAKRIRRISWKDIEPASFASAVDNSVGMEKNKITGVTRIEDNSVLLILDLESIVQDLGLIQPPTEIDKLTDGNEFAGVALLVDDSSTARKAMKTALEHMGFDVVEAFDGEDAIEKIEQQYNSLGESRFQHEMRIIVSDIEMPRMDGFHFASKIKNDTRFKHIPILFNSSISGEFSKEKGREVGGDGYLIKFQPKKFYEEVKRVLTRDD
jgi:two-component system chemotaxis response regulator CheV